MEKVTRVGWLLAAVIMRRSPVEAPRERPPAAGRQARERVTARMASIMQFTQPAQAAGRRELSDVSMDVLHHRRVAPCGYEVGCGLGYQTCGRRWSFDSSYRVQ